MVRRVHELPCVPTARACALRGRRRRNRRHSKRASRAPPHAGGARQRRGRLASAPHTRFRLSHARERGHTRVRRSVARARPRPRTIRPERLRSELHLTAQHRARPPHQGHARPGAPQPGRVHKAAGRRDGTHAALALDRRARLLRGGRRRRHSALARSAAGGVPERSRTQRCREPPAPASREPPAIVASTRHHDSHHPHAHAPTANPAARVAHRRR